MHLQPLKKSYNSASSKEKLGMLVVVFWFYWMIFECTTNSSPWHIFRSSGDRLTSISESFLKASIYCIFSNKNV